MFWPAALLPAWLLQSVGYVLACSLFGMVVCEGVREVGGVSGGREGFRKGREQRGQEVFV